MKSLVYASTKSRVSTASCRSPLWDIVGVALVHVSQRLSEKFRQLSGHPQVPLSRVHFLNPLICNPHIASGFSRWKVCALNCRFLTLEVNPCRLIFLRCMLKGLRLYESDRVTGTFKTVIHE